MKLGILVSTPDLRPSLLSILKGLDEVSLLQKVVTTIAVDPEHIVGKCLEAICKILPLNWRRGIDRRILPRFLRGKVITLYPRELVRLLASKLGNDVLTHRVWLWSELWFDREVARRYSGHFHCFYGMEHSSVETFSRQKDLGGLCILRQVIPHARTVAKIIRQEIEKFPEYTTAYMRLYQKDLERSIERKVAEYQLADLIVANSRFVKDTFVQEGVSAEKIVYVPTGCPPCSDIPANAGRGSRPLIFLFVGALSLRKGLPYLIKAWHLLKPDRQAELWLVGHKELPDFLFKGLGNNVNCFGAISQSELIKLYEQADVLVLPTFLEGLAYVILEALSFGLPIITTKESGCGEFVQEGRNGFVVEAANTASLYKAMAWCLEHRGQLPSMGSASQEQARQWTIADSNKQHLIAIQEFLKKHEIL